MFGARSLDSANSFLAPTRVATWIKPTPLGRRIAETSNANTPRQSPFDGRPHQPGRKERQRYRHIDLAMGSNRQAKHHILAGPLGRRIAETSNANTPRQSPFDGRLHQPGRKERQRYRHIDLANAASFARGNLLDNGGAGNDLKKPTPAARDRCDKRRARLSADRASVLWRRRLGYDDLAPSF